MSSQSPKSSERNNLLILGDPWKALIAALAFTKQGVVPQVLCVSADQQSETLPVYIGNGEYFETAQKIFGEPLTAIVWDLSKSNYQRAKRLLSDLKVPFREEGSLWFGKERQTREPAFSFIKTEFIKGAVKALKKAGVRIVQISGRVKVEKTGPFEFQVSVGTHRYKGTILVVLTEKYSTSLFPVLSDKLIPVTLSSFLCKKLKGPLFSAAFFNAGADFAISEGAHFRLGSYRNLYADKAVGILKRPDPITRKNVSEFFSNLGWVAASKRMPALLDVESLSCDGLPIVGALADMPGVYVVGGFVARTQNFIFEVAEKLASAVVKGSSSQSLDRFSTKRFV